MLFLSLWLVREAQPCPFARPRFNPPTRPPPSRNLAPVSNLKPNLVHSPGSPSAAVWGAGPAAAATEPPAPARPRAATQAARATASRCLGCRARCCRDGSRRAVSLGSPGPSCWDRKARRAGVGVGPIMLLRSACCAARLPPCPRRRGWPDAGRRAAAVVDVRPPRLPPWHDWQSRAAGQPAPEPSRCGGAGVQFGCVPAAQGS
jgi:hypothetical protein